MAFLARISVNWTLLSEVLKCSLERKLLYSDVFSNLFSLRGSPKQQTAATSISLQRATYILSSAAFSQPTRITGWFGWRFWTQSNHAFYPEDPDLLQAQSRRISLASHRYVLFKQCNCCSIRKPRRLSASTFVNRFACMDSPSKLGFNNWVLWSYMESFSVKFLVQCLQNSCILRRHDGRCNAAKSIRKIKYSFSSLSAMGTKGDIESTQRMIESRYYCSH